MRWWCSSRWRPPGISCCRRRSAARSPDFYLARQVREAIAEISPFSPVGGLVTAARLAMLYGMNGAYAAGSVAADMTTKAMAQVPLPWLSAWARLAQSARTRRTATLLTGAMVAVLVLAVPAIGLLVMVQRRGAGWAERMAARFLPGPARRAGFGEAIQALYNSPARLAADRPPCIWWLGCRHRTPPMSRFAWSGARSR